MVHKVTPPMPPGFCSRCQLQLMHSQDRYGNRKLKYWGRYQSTVRVLWLVQGSFDACMPQSQQQLSRYSM